jgi:hypothetical protein
MEVPFRILVSPRGVAERLKTHPHWLFAFLVLCGALLAINIALHSVSSEATLQHIPPSASPSEREYLKQMLDQDIILRLLFLPVRLSIGWGSFALALYYLCLAFRPPESLRFVQIFALEVHAESALVLGQLALLIQSLLAAPAGSFAALIPPLSVAALLPSPVDFAHLAVLVPLNVFSLLYVWILTLGVAHFTGFSRWKAFVVVVCVWVVAVCFNAGTLVMIRTALHLTV